MSKILASLMLLLPLQVDTVVRDIERAFLQNNAKSIYSLLSQKGRIQLSLPEPLSFSDQLSDQQLYFFFKKIFAAYSTSEFYSESRFAAPDRSSYILKTRWSFRDKRNRNRYGFKMFFYLIRRKSNPDGESDSSLWKIMEIRAEKI